MPRQLRWLVIAAAVIVVAALIVLAPPRQRRILGLISMAPVALGVALLLSERPEEATEWRRSTGGQVFVSTNDESARNHVHLAEAVWKRCQRLVEPHVAQPMAGRSRSRIERHRHRRHRHRRY